MKRLFILGATGSIGLQTIDIIRANPKDYSLEAFSFNNNLEKALEIIEEFNPSLVATPNDHNYQFLKKRYPNIKIEKNILMVVTHKKDENNKDDFVVNALVGSVGLIPSKETLMAGRTLLLANKESLVMAGDLLMKLAAEKNLKIVPIDSEHSAIMQVSELCNKKEISKLLLTASGGSLYHLKRSELKDVTIEQALKHPNWKMGSKITIDSATLMNKGFEIIEACYLFNTTPRNIEVVIHPESIIHSMVEFIDHSVIAQLAVSDMRIPILYALNHPHHKENNLSKTLDFQTFKTLHFEILDNKRFPCVELAIDAFNKKGFYPTILNAANEAAVKLFLDKKITFDQIEIIIKNTIEKATQNVWQIIGNYPYDFEHIMKVDEIIKTYIYKEYQIEGGKYENI